MNAALNKSVVCVARDPIRKMAAIAAFAAQYNSVEGSF